MHNNILIICATYILLRPVDRFSGRTDEHDELDLAIMNQFVILFVPMAHVHCFISLMTCEW